MRKLFAYTNIMWIVLAGVLATKLLVSCFIAQYGSVTHFYGSRFDSLLSTVFYAGMAGWFVFLLIFNKEFCETTLNRIAAIVGIAAGGLGVLLNFIGFIIVPGIVLALCEWILVLPAFAAVFVVIGLAQPQKSTLQIAAFAAAGAPIAGVIFARTAASLLVHLGINALIYRGGTAVAYYLLMMCNSLVYMALIFGGYLCFFYLYNAQLNPHSNAPFFNKSKIKKQLPEVL